MRPFLFTIGAMKVPSFFFFIMVAVLATTFYCYWVGVRRGLKPDAILDMGIIGMLAGVLGARIFHILVEYPSYYWAKPVRVFEFWRGGFVSWGGFISVVVALLVYFRIRKLPVLIYFDLLAVAAPVVKFFVRLACLLTGCCYGKPTHVPWAITFTNPASTAYYYYPNTPLHPTQIYSMIHAVLLFIFINWFYRRKNRYDGQTTCVLAMGWTLPRMFIELFRGDVDRGVYFHGLLSTGQITGAVVFVTALLLFYGPHLWFFLLFSSQIIFIKKYF
ncbi:MAG: prolipoprotein diacylglyceryl transferase [Deltaproteobacteria bacterium]|nr:prolipoprotein diacylglyceryl transferase [Deltaproteobacteria bacterium]